MFYLMVEWHFWCSTSLWKNKNSTAVLNLEKSIFDWEWQINSSKYNVGFWINSSEMIYKLWLFNNGNDSIEYFILISNIFTYYHFQYITIYLYPYNVPRKSSIVRNSGGSLLLSGPTGCVFHSINRLKSCSF